MPFEFIGKCATLLIGLLLLGWSFGMGIMGFYGAALAGPRTGLPLMLFAGILAVLGVIFAITGIRAF